jgi:ribosome-associated protein
MGVLFIKPGLVIPDSELSERFIHASGPGGQNVNKVASAVQLSFDVLHSPSLPDPVKVALVRLAGSRLSKEGVLAITARQHREQERNRADARARLADLIRKAATPAKPRRPTRIPKSSKRQRLDTKKQRSRRKQERARPFSD